MLRTYNEIMIALILSTLGICAVLGFSELGWRRHWLNNEVGRKFVHVTVGTFVAFWPFFLTWGQIRLMSVAFLVVVAASDYFKVFRAIHSVQRPTFGEVFFAITVGLLTFITHSKGVYAAALLQMSLADGFAAIFGIHYGRENKYHLLGHTKSIAGTATFVAVSLAILVGYSAWSVAGLHTEIVIFGALAAALLENIAPFGLDNLVVPVFIGLLLSHG
jgi:phytol kinase